MHGGLENMFTKSLFFAVLAFIAALILQILIYQFHLLNKKSIYARLIDYKNANQNILVQTKVKLLKKTKKRFIKAEIPNRENGVAVILVDDETTDGMDKSVAYYDKKKNLYYISNSKKNLEEVEIKPIEKFETYFYSLKDRNHTFTKKSKNIYLNEEQIMFKNPFTGEYYWEKELNGQECITEVDLMNKVPKELDEYFFNTDAMLKAIKYKGSNQFEYINVYALTSGIAAVLIFIFTFFM